MAYHCVIFLSNRYIYIHIHKMHSYIYIVIHPRGRRLPDGHMRWGGVGGVGGVGSGCSPSLYVHTWSMLRKSLGLGWGRHVHSNSGSWQVCANFIRACLYTMASTKMQPR